MARKHEVRGRTLLLSALMVLVVAAAACGSDDGAGVRDLGGSASSGSGSGSGSGSASGSHVASGSEVSECDPYGDSSSADTTVDVTLSEFAIDFDTDVEAGRVNLALENVGEDAHEFVIVKADSIEDLPLGDDELVDESGLEDGAFIGEVEPFPAGSTCEGTFSLDPGDYVAFCNILEIHEGEPENHFQLGMATEFEVSG